MVKSLETLRIEKGWTQEQLAQKAEVDQSAISRIERNGRRGHPSTMQRLAVALGVSVSDIAESAHKAERKRNQAGRLRMSFETYEVSPKPERPAA